MPRKARGEARKARRTVRKERVGSAIARRKASGSRPGPMARKRK